MQGAEAHADGGTDSTPCRLSTAKHLHFPLCYFPLQPNEISTVLQLGPEVVVGDCSESQPEVGDTNWAACISTGRTRT